MSRQIALEGFEKPVDPKDVVFTPMHVSLQIINFLKPTGTILDPCKGNGSFYDQLPEERMYCEVKEGSNFFDFKKPVDWIIGNPPYSLFQEFLTHSFDLANNVSFLVPTNKVFQRQLIMEMINKYGGIKSLIVFGAGVKIGFPFGFSTGNFHFEKNYKGKTEIIIGMKEVFKDNPQRPQQAEAITAE